MLLFTRHDEENFFSEMASAFKEMIKVKILMVLIILNLICGTTHTQGEALVLLN